jgi:hypothetical protein
MFDGALDCAQAASAAVSEMQAHQRDSMSIFYLFLVTLISLAILVNVGAVIVSHSQFVPK